MAAKKKRTKKAEGSSDGLKVVTTYESRVGAVRTVAWSRNGEALAWTGSSGVESTTVAAPLFFEVFGRAPSLAWSHHGTALVVSNGTELLILNQKLQVQGRTGIESDEADVAWSAGDRGIVVNDSSGCLYVDARSLANRKSLISKETNSLALSCSGILAASGGTWLQILRSDGTQQYEGLHDGEAHGLAWSPDEQLLAIGQAGTIKLLDARDCVIRHVIEARAALTEWVGFSSDGFYLAARQWRNASRAVVRIWRTDNYELVAESPGFVQETWITRLAFHPTKPLLAALTNSDKTVVIYELDRKALLGLPPTEKAARYQNAKVLLVGDSGVGKSALTNALTQKKFKATESTHGRRVVAMESITADDDTGGAITRETLLWDLAGQPGYRLVQRIFMDDAAVALVLFDARSETDPFGAATYWARALDQSQTNTKLAKYLVAARTDRGGVGVSQARIDDFVRQHNFTAFIRTSAKTGEGVDELCQQIRDAIRWSELPTVSSTKLVRDVSAFVRDLRTAAAKKKRWIVSAKEIFDAYTKADREQLEEDDFENCLRRLKALDLIDLLDFTVLDEVIEDRRYVLVDSAFVDAYASALVVAAKDEPDGIGHLKQSEVLQGRFPITKQERLPDAKEERIILVATIERLIEKEIALRERIGGEDFLVFPSQYTRDAPFPGSSSYGVRYEFAGAVRNIFTTLVVRLAHATSFKSREFWRDAAAYEANAGGRCIILFKDTELGKGEVVIYFEDEPSEETRRTFLEYVYHHVRDRAKSGSVTRERAYKCPACGYAMDQRVVDHRLESGKNDIICPKCDVRSPLYDLLYAGTPVPENVTEQIRRIDADASRAKMRALAETAIQGKIRTNRHDIFLSYNGDDRATVLELAQSLKTIGLRAWIDVLELVPGRPWQDELEKAIPRLPAAAICVGPGGLGPWEAVEMRAFLDEFVRRKARVIPVLLPGAPPKKDLPIFLKAFTWVDLRDFAPDNVDVLHRLIAGIIDRPPNERIWDELDAILQEELTRAASQPQEPSRLVILPISGDRELDAFTREAIAAQLAAQIGTREVKVLSAVKQKRSTHLHVALSRRSDLERLIKMVSSGDADIIDHLKRWHADPKEFLAINAEAVREILGTK